MDNASVVGFTGAYRDPVTHGVPLGHGYRWYLPALMRFNAPDDLSPFGLGGIHPYAYCTGDPINRTDPSGHTGIEQAVQDVVDALTTLVAKTTDAPLGAQIAPELPGAVKVMGNLPTRIGARAPDHVLITTRGYVPQEDDFIINGAAWHPKNELKLGEAMMLYHYANTSPETVFAKGIQAPRPQNEDDSLHFIKVFDSMRFLSDSTDSPFVESYTSTKTRVGFDRSNDPTRSNAYKHYVIGHPDDYHVGKVGDPSLPTSRIVLRRGEIPSGDIVGSWRIGSGDYRPNPSFKNRLNVAIPDYFLHESHRWYGGDSPLPR